MYFKVVLKSEETNQAHPPYIVRYMEADNTEALLRVLKCYYGTSYVTPGDNLKVLKTVDRDEFEWSRSIHQGMLQ